MDTTNNPLNSSICVEAQRRIDRHYTAVVQRITALCSVAALPDEVTQAIIADFNDILQDSYRGLRLSIEGIELLATKTTRQQWRRLQSPALWELIDEYNSIGALLLTEDKTAVHELLSNPDKLTEALQDANGITAVTIYEVSKATGADSWQLFNIAVTYRHVYIILQYGEAFGIPAEQLQDIEPAFIGKSTPENDAKLRQMLKNHAKHLTQTAADTVAKNAGRKRAPLAGLIDADGNDIPEAEPTTAAPQEPEAEEPTDAEVVEEYADREAEEIEEKEQQRTIAQYQNVTEMLSSPLQVNSKYKDASAQLLPLRQAIEQQQAVANRAKKRLTELLSNPNATPQALKDAQKDSDDADNLIASQTYIMQAFTGIAALANKKAPDGAVTDYYDYGVMPANDFIRLCTGDNLNADGTLQSIGSKQKIGILRAANYLSTIRCRATETVLKPKKVKDDSGKWITKYTEQKEHYVFTPAVINFRGTSGDDEVPPTDAVTVSVQIYRNIVTGRRQETIEVTDEHGRKKLLPVKQPNRHVLTDTQLYAFTTDEEKRLLNTLLSKNHKDEAELLADVFDYDSRIAVMRSAVSEAKDEQQRHALTLAAAMLTETEQEHDAKNIKLQAKIEEAKTKLERTESNIKKNRARDAAKLRELLHKAAENGIIQNYWRTPLHGDSHSTQRPVWNWTRPTADDIKQRRTRRKKQQQ